MKPNVDSLLAIMLGYQNGRETLEALRVKDIRKSDIVTDAPAFNGAFESAKYLGVSKPMTGLVSLRKILTKMGR